MPGIRRKPKPRASKSEAMGSKTASVVQSVAPNNTKTDPVIVLDSAPSTPTPTPEKPADADESLSNAHTPLEGGTPDDTDSESHTSVSEHEPSEDATSSNQDICATGLKEAAPPVPEKVKCSTLKAEIQQTHDIAEARAANGDPLLSWLVPVGRTGDQLVDQAMNDLRSSEPVLWPGASDVVLQSCEWMPGQSPNTWTLQLKPNASKGTTGDEGDAVFGVVGRVQLYGSALNPDAGFQSSWGEDGVHKQKRTFDLVYPGFASNIPLSWWDRQMGGTDLMINNGRKLSDGTTGAIGNCFLNRHTGALRFRSPVFQPLPTAEECREFGRLPPKPEEDLPENFRYSTWKFDSPAVRNTFDRVIARGFEPQPIEAYGRNNNLLHPNVVSTTLSGAIVVVYFTLERALFNANSRSKLKPPEWQFFANLVKVQVLKLADTEKSAIAPKRKVAFGYDPENVPESEGSPSKARKSVRVPTVLN